MIRIFEQGSLRAYSNVRLDESMSPILSHSQFSSKKTTVFISHKHDELEDLKGLLGFLEQNYDVKVYIDSRDSTMPAVTSAKTALNIKNRIKQCDKFILLATNGAIESKWCNWELGYGDAHKYRDNIALFPMKPQNATDNLYKGSEYMWIYPCIVYCDGTETYSEGGQVTSGYYVSWYEGSVNHIKPLRQWFSK